MKSFLAKFTVFVAVISLWSLVRVPAAEVSNNYQQVIKRAEQAKLKLDKSTASIKSTPNTLDQKLEEAVKLSIEQYGPASEKTKTLIDRYIYSVSTFAARKRIVDLVLNECLAKFDRCSKEVLDYEAKLAFLYSHAGNESKAREVFASSLAKVEKSRNTGDDADLRCFKINSLLGESNLRDNNLQLAEFYLGKAVVYCKKHPTCNERVSLVTQYIVALKKQGKSAKVKDAEAELKEARHILLVEQLPAF